MYVVAVELFSFLLLFFFFQAEDGIRDTSVTGVQTCALPISMPINSTCTLKVKRSDRRSQGAYEFLHIRWRAVFSQLRYRPRYRVGYALETFGCTSQKNQ